MAVTVCNTTNLQCMMYRCKNCPGYPALEKFIRNKFTELEIDEMSYSQLESVNKTTLWTDTADVDDIIELLVYLQHTPSWQRAKLSISNTGKKNNKDSVSFS